MRVKSDAGPAIPLDFFLLIGDLNPWKIVLLAVMFLALHNRTIGLDGIPRRVGPKTNRIISLSPIILGVIVTSHPV